MSEFVFDRFRTCGATTRSAVERDVNFFLRSCWRSQSPCGRCTPIVFSKSIATVVLIRHSCSNWSAAQWITVTQLNTKSWRSWNLCCLVVVYSLFLTFHIVILGYFSLAGSRKNILHKQFHLWAIDELKNFLRYIEMNINCKCIL